MYVSSDLWIPCSSFWFGIRRSTHDTIQSIFVVAVDSLATDRSSCCFLIPERVPSRCSSVNSVLPTQAPSFPSCFQHDSRDVHSTCSVPARQTCRCCRCRAFPKILLKGEHPSLPVLYLVISQATCLISHTTAGCFQQQTTTDSRFQSQLVCHKDSAVNLNACFDRSLALMTVWRSVSWQSSMNSSIRN